MMKLRITFLFVLLSMQSVFAEEVIDQNDDSPVTKEIAINPDNRVLSSIDLLDMLVTSGVLTQQRANDLLQEIVSKKSAQQIKELKNNQGDSAINPKLVRVPYVPEFIKNQIRDEVRLSLREEVVGDVIGKARHERWGVPGAMPEWVSRIKFKGDLRLRYQGDYFADNLGVGGFSENLYFNSMAVNSAGNKDDISTLKNITEDRNRFRTRLRLAMDAKVTQGIKVGMRLATGKFNDPVSTNQTMGNSFQPYKIILDRAYLKIETEYKELTFWGGRMPNPWMSTDLVWDKDLNFDGFALKYRPLQSDDMDNDERIFDTSITLGAFPLEEVALSSKDKWLFGLQLGFNWKFINQNKFDIGIAYYDYKNIEGKANTTGSNLNDYTASSFMQNGNTLFNIANPVDPAATDQLWALVSDYDLVNFIISYKMAQFAPINVEIKADFVKNVGYDESEILVRTGNQFVTPRLCLETPCIQSSPTDSSAKVTGYQLMIKIGWPSLKQRNNWDMAMAYRYLERDAVLDAFTDSDFRNGGTDSKGWWLKGRYAIDDNTWMSVKLISADEIDGPTYGVDTLQFDLVASF